MSEVTINILQDSGAWYLRLHHVSSGNERVIPLEFLIDNKQLSSWPEGLEYRIQQPDLLRIRGRGRTTLRFRFDEIKQFENACAREDGSIETAFLMTGKLLFVPLRGALWHNAMWIPEKAQANDYIIDLIPSIETFEFEVAIHAYYSNGVRNDSYIAFDAI